MFALWYLSLAIEEVRKRFGWTFFGFFKTNKTVNNNKALDNKPSTSDTKVPSPVAAPELKVPEKMPVPTEPKQTPQVPKPATAPEVKVPAPSEPKQTPQVPEQKPAAPVVPKAVEKPKEPTPKAPAVPVPVEALEKPKETTPATPTLPTAPAPIKALNPTPTIAPIAPLAPFTATAQNGNDANDNDINDSTADALDRKLFGATKPFENGEKLRTNLKDATINFLDGEGKLGAPLYSAPLAAASNTEDMVDAAVLTKLEEGYAKLAASDSKSLLKKYLTKAIFDDLKNKKTPTFGSTLLDVIQSGLENHDSGVGIYAPDAEAYTVFAPLFDPIIEDYHGGFKKTDKHPPREFGDVSTFGNLDPNNEFVISTRVRCGRSLQGYPFNPCLTEAQYKEMEQKVSTTLSGLEGELKGKFYPLTGMEKTVQQQLIDDHFLFKEGDRFLQAANACRYWPSGRGIYHNDNKTFLVWCNEEDHLRIISMQQGGDLGEVYRRLVTAVNDIEKRIPFSHDDRLGFLTFCPTNLGTTIRASVHIKVPKLAANKAKLEEVAGKYNLQVRGTRGEHTEAEGGVYDISNKRRMGLTEYCAVKEMYDGITELIKLEKSL